MQNRLRNNNNNNNKKLLQPPTVSQIEKVLTYEERMGYENSVGRSGETFAAWTSKALQGLALHTDVDISAEHDCKLAAQQLEKYSTLYLSARAVVVKQTREAVHAAQVSMKEARVRLDVAAELAHSEELSPPSEVLEERKREEGALNIPITTTATTKITTRGKDGDDGRPGISLVPRPTISSSSSFTDLGTPSDDSAIITPGSEGGVLGGGKRKVKEETIEFRRQFKEYAAALCSTPRVSQLSASSGEEQRSQLWHHLRQKRLTASAFSKAIGLFNGDRNILWEEKVGLRQPFAGNVATQWGTHAEPKALQEYQRLTGQVIEPCMFKVKHDDPAHSWLGASPDGLIAALEVHTVQSTSSSNNNLMNGPGVLEIKCPFNKGHPELAVPPPHAIWYYMPQVQGLMDIFDREWCNMYIWTPEHGSASYYIPRDRQYWAAAYDVLSEFWWAHVVPARQAREKGAGVEELEQWRVSEEHGKSWELKQWSKKMAVDAVVTFFK
jgi:putative phage-type endonuclease